MRRACLGLAGQTTPLDSRLARRLHRERDSAVLVAEVIAGGPAERAGVQAGDLILTFGEATSSPSTTCTACSQPRPRIGRRTWWSCAGPRSRHSRCVRSRTTSAAVNRPILGGAWPC